MRRHKHAEPQQLSATEISTCGTIITLYSNTYLVMLYIYQKQNQ